MPTDKREALGGGEANSVDDLPIGVLHLGTKTKLLEEAGFLTLRDLRDVDAASVLRIPSVGRRTADELVRNQTALRKAADQNGAIDWTTYCAALGIRLLPAQAPADGCELLAGLPAFLESLAENLEDNVLAAILLGRICRSPGRQKTLEEIGSAASPVLSRERVRQKERRLLLNITGGLLNDNYAALHIHFHPGFASWWQKAADALVDVEEIGVASFVELLAGVWSVPHAAVLEQLPTLVAVVTGEPQMTSGFRALAHLDPRLFAEGGQNLNNLPVLKLRLGKVAVRLVEAGLPLVGDVIDSLQSGNTHKIGMTAMKRVADHLNIVASCMSITGVDWNCYQSRINIECLPLTSTGTPIDFVSTLPQVIEELLRRQGVSLRAADIFRHRTRKHYRHRMTLHQVAETLGTFGSSIKREETIFLAWLNDVLVSREFFRLSVWLDATWLTWWREAEETYEQSQGEYDRFANNLGWRWRLSGKEINTAAPTLWAVFTGYPEGRRLSVIALYEASPKLGRIRLQGFRRVH
ncbi:hypothetical protein DFR52_103558 [Hoeflea marina]|uniref:RNA polymerase alpha subunit n=1 Tax=Hoeflea marina TaxID=274592 RepID=A0A317PL07_9HYPH|nr:hypothetical protein [Hoeflea marina]PWW00355.1 hypothetical protein DFR52_103558 [Hoeflea marina]